jgi:predicted DNA-binding transcriptional regulator AlpA
MDVPHQSLSDLLTEPQAARLCCVPVRTLARWRREGRAPPHVLLGDRVLRYRVADVIAYLERHLRAGPTTTR